MTEPDHIRVQASGLNFSALAWGEPSAPLALCLHGYPDTAWTWRHLGPYLAERGRRVVAPFGRGYAPTELAPDDDYRVQTLARDALALHDALDGGDDAVLIGHDWGAVAAYKSTHLAPGTFRRVVSVAVPPLAALRPALRPPGRLRRLGRQARNSWYIGFQQLAGVAERSLDRLIPRIWVDWSPGYDAREDVAHFMDAVRGPGRRRAVLRYYRDIKQPSNAKDMFAAPRTPVLYTHGAQDGCLTPEFFEPAREMLPAGSRAELIEDAGHFMHLEQPGTVNALIGDWVGAA